MKKRNIILLYFSPALWTVKMMDCRSFLGVSKRTRHVMDIIDLYIYLSDILLKITLLILI